MMSWGFYGRNDELRKVTDILSRNRWFFAKLTGRRRIGKTTLIQQAIQAAGERPVFYVQIPDSGPAGVLSAVRDAMENFRVQNDRFAPPRTLAELAKMIGDLVRTAHVVVLDEFQYFNREKLRPFCSFLQAEVDRLAADASRVSGGLIVLGSIHTEMTALLEDRAAPLYNRTTDEIALTHLDIASVLEVLREHADESPERLLFLWTLFEGVPKFYRDCYEQDVLGADRRELLAKIFFASSSPLRTEAENWFLRELRGRYDVVLKFVARRGGCMHNELVAHIQEISGESSEQVSGYLKILVERYGLIEKRLPIFSSAKARKSRYYLADNFLKAWLAAIGGAVAAINFQPLEKLVGVADERLAAVEGRCLEKLVGQLYEERSRKGVTDFALTHRIEGYWDKGGVEIDLVAVNEADSVIRFGSCKRTEEQLLGDIPVLEAHIQRFLAGQPRFRSWTIERVSIAPTIPSDLRGKLTLAGHLAQDLRDLTKGL